MMFDDAKKFIARCGNEYRFFMARIQKPWKLPEEKDI